MASLTSLSSRSLALVAEAAAATATWLVAIDNNNLVLFRRRISSQPFSCSNVFVLVQKI